MGKLTNKWETNINKLFKGKTIKSIRYLTQKEIHFNRLSETSSDGSSGSLSQRARR